MLGLSERRKRRLWMSDVRSEMLSYDIADDGGDALVADFYRHVVISLVASAPSDWVRHAYDKWPELRDVVSVAASDGRRRG